jgi:Bardet-Biedl syndrome 7 protein
MIPLLGPSDWLPALACQDRHIRILQGEQVLMDISTVAAPVSLLYNPDAHDARGLHPGAKELLYGTETGAWQCYKIGVS